MNRHGQMVLDMKGNGGTTKLMVKVNSGMLMVIIIMGNGRMIKLMVMECMYIRMGLDMKGNGWMTCSMEKELKCGRILANIKVVIKKAKKMVRGTTLGLMVVSI